MIAQQVAIDFPEKIEKLVLCSTSCGASKGISPSPELTQFLVDRAHGKLTDEEITTMRVNYCFPAEFQQAHPDDVAYFLEKTARNMMSPDHFNRQLQAVMVFNSARFLKNVQAPTLILHGKQDELTPPGNAEILAKYISGARVAYSEQCGHALYTVISNLGNLGHFIQIA